MSYSFFSHFYNKKGDGVFLIKTLGFPSEPPINIGIKAYLLTKWEVTKPDEDLITVNIVALHEFNNEKDFNDFNETYKHRKRKNSGIRYYPLSR